MKEKARQRKEILCAAAIFFFAMTFLGFLYPVFSLAQPKSAKNLSIATGGTGGVYYVVGGGIAAVISKYLPGVQANAEVTAAAVDNCKLLMSRQVDMAFCNGDVAYDAYAGLERFKATGKVPVRALAVLYSSPFHVATLEGAGIDKIADLKGKRVSTGAPGSGAEIIALRILEAAGLDPSKDIRRERLSVAECASAVRDRKIDAAFVGL